MEIQRYLSYISLVQMIFLFVTFFKETASYRFFMLTVFIIPIAFLRLMNQFVYNIHDQAYDYMIPSLDSPANLFEFIRFLSPDKKHSQFQEEYLIQILSIFLQFIVVFTLRRMILEEQRSKQRRSSVK